MDKSEIKKSRWSKEQCQKLNQFLISQQIPLLVNFYKNVLVGSLDFRRDANFFQKMGAFVGRSAKQCKSKMQKYEITAFTKILKIPKHHYHFFLLLRKLKQIKKHNYKMFKMFKKKNLFEAKKHQIIEELKSEKISFGGK